MKTGLKLWSGNLHYIASAAKLFRKNIFDYIELYIEPGTTQNRARWNELEIPYQLHAPHSLSGLNPSLPECMERNLQLVKEVEKYTETLNPDFIIFHPGLNGKLEETIRQLCEIRRRFPEIHKRMLVENKPKVGLNGENCLGASPGEIKRIMEKVAIAFCLDIGHAVNAANSLNKDWKDFMSEFIALNPCVLHLSDGDAGSERDSHLNYGTGSFDLEEILRKIPSDILLTIETVKSSRGNLDDFVKDAKFLDKLLT